MEYVTRGQVIGAFILMVLGCFGWGINQYMIVHDANLRMELSVESLRAQVNSQAGMISEMHNKQASDHDIIVTMAGDIHEVKSWAYSGENGINSRKR